MRIWRGLAGTLYRTSTKFTNSSSIGLSPTTPRSLGYNHPAPSELMPRRLQLLGFDPAYVRVAQTATYRDLQRVCAVCKAWRRCAHDLANGDTQAGMSGYCLNAYTIDTPVGRLAEHAEALASKVMLADVAQ
jgi:hypothetical protein